MELKEPVKAKQSENYLAVLEDADGVEHFWLPNGKYDGYSRPRNTDNAKNDSG